MLIEFATQSGSNWR